MKKRARRPTEAIPDPEPYPSSSQLRDLRQDLERVCPAGALLDDALVEGVFWDLDEGRFATAEEALQAALACREQLRALTPPYDRLKRLAETSPPPAEWLEEDMEGLF